MRQAKVIIIGAGPAGLTAAYELLDRTDLLPVVYEATDAIGGIARTEHFKGNRIDLGGHRFFSKSDRVMDWWLNIFPRQGAPARDDRLLGRPVLLESEVSPRPLASRVAVKRPSPDPEREDEVMLSRGRISRVFFLRKFFDYPLSLSVRTLAQLGPARVARIALSYLRVRLSPPRPEKSLEDFFINRFGLELYRTFFRDYTEKIWGIPCDRINPEWGAQRVKGLSVGGVIVHAVRSLFRRDRTPGQKGTETSLIEHFLYPKFGPGQLWEAVADRVIRGGGRLERNHRVVGIECEGDRVRGVRVRDGASGREHTEPADFVISTMPVRDLVAAMSPPPPAEVRRVADGLQYRDFITVGLLLKKLAIRNTTRRPTLNDLIPDNWIYVQEPDVKIGRLQVFNNWSPYLVRDPSTVWLGLEYFCCEGDDLWNLKDSALVDLGARELSSMGIIDPADVLDAVVIRVPKAYPAYTGTYAELGIVREFMDRIGNLFLIGRNGMHRYNNMDHSMLTAMAAVDSLAQGGGGSRELIWQVNAEQEYHERK